MTRLKPELLGWWCRLTAELPPDGLADTCLLGMVKPRLCIQVCLLGHGGFRSFRRPRRDGRLARPRRDGRLVNCQWVTILGCAVTDTGAYQRLLRVELSADGGVP